MYAKTSKAGYIPAAPGIRRKTLVYGDKTLMTEFLLDKGTLLANYSHPHEQTGYLVSTHMILTIGNEAQEIRPGDSWMIPGEGEHHAEILEDSVAVEVFSAAKGGVCGVRGVAEVTKNRKTGFRINKTRGKPSAPTGTRTRV